VNQKRQKFKTWWRLATARKRRQNRLKTKLDFWLIRRKEQFPRVTANKITVARIPVAVAAFLCFPTYYWKALCLYTVTAFLDIVDGKWARANEEETDIGKIIDPLVDKMSVLLFLYMFALEGFLDKKIVGLIIALEFASTFVYAYTATKGNLKGANKWGKAKKWAQDICVLLTLIVFLTGPDIPLNAILGIACVLSGLSSFCRLREGIKRNPQSSQSAQN
jgi:CDP-diacylglycerol--glycerol-3-phosphate 3-phosphatidyltransferase|tara:strand:+ start:32 stop:691 length:660 start_codon:yes stop_codon:yes gene_type:complete